MGYNTALDLSDSNIDLETQIAMHLRVNHYPPVPVAMVQPCIDAIDAWWDGDYHREIDLPKDITWRDKTQAPASAIIEAHHLDAWLVDFYDEEEE
jgi:hypothetical protein